MENIEKETVLKIALAINKIALTLSEEDFSKVKKYLSEIEECVLQIIKKGEE